MNYPTVREAVELLVQSNGGPSTEVDTVFAKLILGTPVTIMRIAEEQALRAKEMGRIVGVAVVKEESEIVISHLHHGVLDQVLSAALDHIMEEHEDFRAYHH